MQQTIPRLPAQDDRTQRFSQLVANLLNALLLQGYLVQTGPSTFVPSLTGGPGVGLDASLVLATRTFLPPPPPPGPRAEDANVHLAQRTFLPPAPGPPAGLGNAGDILANQIFGG